MDSLIQELAELYKQKEILESKIKSLELQIQKSNDTFVVLKDAIYINTKYLSKDLLNKLKATATFENPQVQILASLRKKPFGIPKYITSYQLINNQLILPRGLMREVIGILKTNNLETTFLDQRFVKPYRFKTIKFEPKSNQIEAIDTILKKDFSIFVAPPGFGKTYIGSKTIQLRGVNTLVIVNKNMLLDQWFERFIQYFEYDKKEIGVLGKSKNTLNGNLDIATMQSLKNNPELIKNYSYVIVDECHHIPALTFETIIKNFQGKYILGLSATPNRKDGMEPLLFQQLGNISYEVKSQRSNSKKLYIVESEFQSDKESFSELVSEMITDEARNLLIIDQVLKYKQRKILILSDRIEHLENLELLLKYHQLTYVCIHGSLSKKEQEESLQAIEQSDLVLATTSYFGEGVDFAHLDTIILATPISYYGRLVQYLGRIGRNGNDTIAIDILDIYNKFALSSYKKRKEGYKQLHYIKAK